MLKDRDKLFKHAMVVVECQEIEPSEAWTLFKPFSQINLKKKRNLKKFKKDPLAYLGPKSAAIYFAAFFQKMMTTRLDYMQLKDSVQIVDL
jgi:hypothetical protein